MTGAGVTVVLCGAAGCHCAQHEPLREVLRTVVRSTELGVLVVSGCMCGRPCGAGCRADRREGALVAVQPCDVERRPVAPVVLIGPVRTAGDVAAVREWLSNPNYDPATLPRRLVEHRG